MNMEYLFYLLYVVVAAQLFISKPKKNIGYTKGRSFYKVSGIVNVILGVAGMTAINLLLRDKGIIPQMYVWIGLIGFMFIEFYGLFCIIKMILSSEP